MGIYAIDTEEKMNWLLKGLEDGEIILNNKIRTEEEKEELRREIAEYKANRQKNKVEEPVLA
jgi:hypothetical protein